jgi:hypothetical protein
VITGLEPAPTAVNASWTFRHHLPAARSASKPSGCENHPGRQGDSSLNTQAIAAEIRALRKGRAVDSTDLATRIGPCLRDLVSGAEPAALRRELAAALATCARRLPADLGRAIMASLALSTETKGLAHFSDRMAWLAGELGFGYRTALRRVEAAERLLAEEIGLELRRRQERPAGGAEDTT